MEAFKVYKWENKVTQNCMEIDIHVFYLKLAGTPSLPSLKIKFEKTLWNCDPIP